MALIDDLLKKLLEEEEYPQRPNPGTNPPWEVQGGGAFPPTVNDEPHIRDSIARYLQERGVPSGITSQYSKVPRFEQFPDSINAAGQEGFMGSNKLSLTNPRYNPDSMRQLEAAAIEEPIHLRDKELSGKGGVVDMYRPAALSNSFPFTRAINQIKQNPQESPFLSQLNEIDPRSKYDMAHLLTAMIHSQMGTSPFRRTPVGQRNSLDIPKGLQEFINRIYGE